MSNLIIDGNSLLYAANDAKPLTCDGTEVQAVYNSLRSIASLMEKYRGATPIVLWDGKAKWRFDLWPHYKGNRRSTPAQIANKESVRRQRPLLIAMLNQLGVAQFLGVEAEADDVAASIVFRNPDHRLILVTGDRDWLQLLERDEIIWTDNRIGATCTLKQLQDFTGYKTPKAFVQAKCLAGDTSDNIPGVGGIGKDRALELLNKYGNVKYFLADDFNDSWPKWMKDFHRNERPKASDKWGEMELPFNALERNRKLMDLKYGAQNFSRVIKNRKPFVYTDAVEILKAWQFFSLSSNSQILGLFERSAQTPITINI